MHVIAFALFFTTLAFAFGMLATLVATNWWEALLILVVVWALTIGYARDILEGP